MNALTPRLSSFSLPRGIRFIALALLFSAAPALLLAQANTLQTISSEDPQTGSAASTAALDGTVVDAKGGLIANAVVIVRNEASGRTRTTTADAAGHFAVANLPPGSYTVDASAPGFATFTRKGIQVADGQPTTVSFTLQIGSTTADITVEADTTGSVAATLAPMDALLTATSARTEITAAMIQNFMSPVADYGEAVQMAPATFTLNGNGVGLGQSKTYFRGFPDGDYDIKFDGIPWSDTNSVSHHSWAFFPAQFLGGIDFDRSPGTASTIGYAPFGGSINLLSKEMNPLQNVRATFAGGSFNTYLYDLEYDSGAFGPGRKFNLNVDVHHMQSHGYQTGNNQTRNAGALKFVYAPSNTFSITGFSGVIWLDANTPNFSATRCQMYGADPAGSYTCTGSLAPYAGSGINFLLTNNADPELYLDQKYNSYHVPTDFEYVGVHKDFAHGFTLDVKAYTYNYDNSEKYSNAVPITDDPTQLGTTYAPLGVKVTALCNQLVTKKGVTAEPCEVDKYNSYRTYGETSQLSQASKFGILRAGVWYSWNNTNRHQYPTDPLTGYVDQELPNFKEKFVQNDTEPFIEYQYHVTKKLDFTPGVKFSYFTIGTQQFADNGKTIGCFQPASAGCNPTTNTNINPNQFISNGGNYFATLPSGSFNYRILNNWSAYVQAAQGSIVPPSSVFDFQQGTSGTAIPPAVLPKQQKNTTYQGGTVLKFKRVTFDADFYHIHFDNSYSSVLNSAGEPVFYVQPSSITKGLEGESNIYLTHGLSVYLNASYDKATYSGSLPATCTGSASVCAAAGTLNVTAPSGLNVQQTPSDIETEGITYQHKNIDFGFFNKRVGTFYIDNGSYHNQATIDPFTTSNLFLNYTLRSNGRFDNTKFRVSLNNLLNEHSITGDSIAGSVVPAAPIAANGTTYTDPFNTNGQTPINGGDNISILPARSVMFSVTFGLNPRGR